MKIDDEFDWSSDPKALRQAYNERDFDAKFISTIAKDVILVLSPQLLSEPYNSSYDDNIVYDRLLDPLERFICGLDDKAPQENIKIVLDEIRSADQPTKLCRRILKTGDVTFSCNDCGMDGSCVLCIDCFLKSAHKDHSYRMANSGSGGCCDCGDVEAWKQFHACTDHLASDQSTISPENFMTKGLRSIQIERDRLAVIESIKRLPGNFATRYFLICQASLHYAYMMLGWTKNDTLPPSLEIYGDTEKDSEVRNLLSMSKSKKNYFTVLFNDEVHTYDHVIATLVKIIKCSKMTASIMANTISREGRSLIAKDTQFHCDTYTTKISQARDATQGPLKVASIHGKIIAHQAFAIKLIEWIRKLSSMSDGIRNLTAYTLLGDGDILGDNYSETMFERIALSNTKTWKIARVEWNDLFVKTLLTDYCIKQQVARLLTRNYPQLTEDFINDDHDRSVSVLTLTTQIYTVPSLICLLIEEEAALRLTLGTFVYICKKSKRDNQGNNFENRHTFDMMPMRRSYYAADDFYHLICSKPAKWTFILRKEVLNAVNLFLDLLESLQGMDSVKRQLGQHLEYEPDWESGMSLQERLIYIITRFIEFIDYDREVLVESVSETLTRLAKICRYKGYITRDLFNHSANCINYDVSTMPVSIHLPMTRFAAALIVLYMQRNPCDTIPYDENLVVIPKQTEVKTKMTMIEIMEPSLRAEVMIAQFRSSMWRRNGYSLINQIQNFTSAKMRREMFDRDILVLQECAAVCEPNEFMIHLINKFNLFHWITSDEIGDGTAASKNNDEELLTQTMSLGDEFLQILLIIIGERYCIGIGNITKEDIIKNEIIQLLCIAPMARSDLTYKLQVRDYELDCIKSVAELKRSTSTTAGKYELREEFYDRFNPFFYHYTRRYQSNALDAQLKRKKNLKQELICCPPPRPVKLTKQFSNLNELLKCDILLKLIAKILRRCLEVPCDAKNSQSDSTNSSSTSTPSGPNKFGASELQLDQCLHLIGLGLWEQERDPTGYRYMDAAHSNQIFDLIKDNYEKSERNKDLLMWLMKKTDAMVNMITTRANDGQLVDDLSLETCSHIKNIFKSSLCVADTSNLETKKQNSMLASQRRDRIMAMMKAKQEKFMSYQTTKELVAETEKHEAPKVSQDHSPLASGSIRLRKSKPPKSIMGFASSSKINKCVDTTRGPPPTLQSTTSESEQFLIDLDEPELEPELLVPQDTTQMCILCRDEQNIGFDKPTMVLLAFVQRSAVLSRNRKQRRIPNYAIIPHYLMRSQLMSRNSFNMGQQKFSYTSDNSWSFDATFMPSDMFFSPHISTCGHVMHYDCWRAHTEAVLKRETSRSNRSNPHVSFEPDKHEILCPLCDCISNATIPLIPNYTCFAGRRVNPLAVDGPSIFNLNSDLVEKTSGEALSAFLVAIRSSVDTLKQIRQVKQDLSTSKTNYDCEKYLRLLQPRQLNDVLVELDETSALGLRNFLSSVRTNRILPKSCSKTMLNSITALAERIHLVGLDLDRCIIEWRIFLMTSWTVAYTLQTYERSSRFKGSPIFDDLESSSKSIGLSSLLRYAFTSMLTQQSDMIQSLLIRKLRYLLINDEHLSSSPSCLDIDAYETLLSLLIMLPKLYSHVVDLKPVLGSDQPSSSSSTSKSTSAYNSEPHQWVTEALDNEYSRNLIHLMLILNLVQICITLQSEIAEAAEKESCHKDEDFTMIDEDILEDSQELRECGALECFYRDCIIASGHPYAKLDKVDGHFCRRIKARMLPFLRSCGMLMYHLSLIPFPDCLKTHSAFKRVPDNGTQVNFDDQVDWPLVDNEFNSLCHYLNLPSKFSTLLNSHEALHLAKSWLRHSRVMILIKSKLKFKEPLTSVIDEMDEPEPVQLSKSCPTTRSHTSAQLLKQQREQQQQHQQQQQQYGSELMPIEFIGQPHPVPRLIELPYDYSELVDRVSEFTCPNVKNQDSRTPTMCLVCGVILCSHSYCCQRDLNDLASDYRQMTVQRQITDQMRRGSSGSLSEGAGQSSSFIASNWHPDHAISLVTNNATTPQSVNTNQERTLISNVQIFQQLVGSCTYHAYECSGGVGLFLRIRKCQILMISGKSKGCYQAAPYNDDHGETDFGLIRGNPLHLNKEHYRKIEQAWLNHTLAEQISRSLEYSPYLSSISWYLH